MSQNNNQSEVIDLYQKVQEIKEMVTDLEFGINYNYCHLKAQLSECESEPDDSSEDNCLRGDSK